ncbi:MAG: tetratricopeptide repeat protein [Acidobacteria bacterium]|nr:tetratricopeptide repeat protein [Acidobacteriota bacterium]
MAFNKAKAIEAAQQLFNQGKLKEAVAEYLKIHKQEPKDQNVLNTLGDLYARLNNNPEALNYYGKLADLYVGDGFLVRGIAMYKKISKLDLSNTNALERLADLYTMQGLMTEARQQYLQLAEVLLKANNAQKAIEVMNKVLDLDPENVKIQQRLADLYERHGQKAEAAHVYRRLAERLLHSEQIDESQKWLQKATALAPQDPEVLLFKAKLLERQGKGEEALAILERIPNLDQHPEAQELLMKARLGAGEAGSAEEMAEQLFAADPKNFSSLLQLAQHAAQEQDGQKALGLLERIAKPALAHDPFHFLPVARSVSALLQGSGSAADLLIQAARKAGDSSALLEALSRRAGLAARAEDHSLAKQLYHQLVSLQPENPEFTQQLNRIREKLGEPAGVVEASTPPVPAAAAAPEAALDEDTLAYINASMTDIDLFSSYGMTDKAIELARQVIGRVPSHLPAHEKLLDFYVGTGNDQGVVELAPKLQALYRQAGTHGRAEEVGELARGYAEKLGKEVPAAAGVEAPAAAVPEPVLHEVDLSAEWASATGPEEGPAAAVEIPAAAFNAAEAAQEIDFYLAQGLADQARETVARYERDFPGEPALAELRARVEGAAAPVEAAPAEAAVAREGETYEIALEPEPPAQPAAPAAAGPMSAGDFFADLASDLDQALAGAAPPRAKGPAAKAPVAAGAEPPAGALAEVFEEFKEELGTVEEVEDVETHYNLGIAYKEMGLMEEAISEFQKVVKAAEKTADATHLFRVCTLLGVCFMEKGLPNIAVRWYERALKAPGLDEEGALALRYDMGVAHEQAGNRKAALDCFMEVYGANVDYRNVGERIRELQGS